MAATAPVLDILFRVTGTEVPADHGYALFGAISRILESDGDRWLHANPAIGLHTVRGAPGAPGRYPAKARRMQVTTSCSRRRSRW